MRPIAFVDPGAFLVTYVVRPSQEGFWTKSQNREPAGQVRSFLLAAKHYGIGLRINLMTMSEPSYRTVGLHPASWRRM